MSRKRRGCLIAGGLMVVAIGFVVHGVISASVPRDLADDDPHDVFEEFVCSPAPDSLVVVDVTGVIALAGGNVFIEFEFVGEDLERLIARGAFRELRDHDPKWISEYLPEEAEGEVRRYTKDCEGMAEAALVVDAGLGRAWFREVHY